MNATGKGGFGEQPQYINRNGRPPKDQSVTDLLRETVNKQDLVDKLVEIAVEKGDIQALKYAIDRMDGKPTETVHNLMQQLPDVIEVDLTEHTTDIPDAPTLEIDEQIQDS